MTPEGEIFLIGGRNSYYEHSCFMLTSVTSLETPDYKLKRMRNTFASHYYHCMASVTLPSGRYIFVLGGRNIPSKDDTLDAFSENQGNSAPPVSNECEYFDIDNGDWI